MKDNKDTTISEILQEFAREVDSQGWFEGDLTSAEQALNQHYLKIALEMVDAWCDDCENGICETYESGDKYADKIQEPCGTCYELRAAFQKKWGVK